MNKYCVGIDIAKQTFVTAIKVGDKFKTKSFGNNAKGFAQLLNWVKPPKGSQPHYCMEATGKYGNALALFLHDNKHRVSIVNPMRIKRYMESLGVRTKTDDSDAKNIQLYCVATNLSLWQPKSETITLLQQLVRRIDTLTGIISQEKNRKECVDEFTLTSINKHIIYLKKEIAEHEATVKQLINSDAKLKTKAKLLRTIPGVGIKTTNKALAFLSNVEDFSEANKLVAFLGLNPKIERSGSSLNRSSLAKTGNAYCRKMFYMPAVVAIQHNQALVLFYNRLLKKGKAKKAALCAVMRKLVRIIYGVLKSKKPYDHKLVIAKKKLASH